METEGELQARYDETPYRDEIFPDLDAARLFGLASLFQLRPDRTEGRELRVLDLACASGAHVRDQAARHHGIHFTGVDFSRTEIEAGRKQIIESGLTNVELIHSDLRTLETESSGFDLVLCHGAFSWVTDDVKERIFELIRRSLKPTGLAAIAYLTYPGWKQREALRELLAFRAAGVADPQERLKQSALLLRLLHSGYAEHEGDCHAESLKKTVESMQRASANVFLHDELGLIHDPCYFLQFVEWAGEWGLQYLAETDLGAMALEGLPASAAPILHELAPGFLETQQLIDFLVNRSGRTSMLVRDDAPIARELDVNGLRDLAYSTALLPMTAAKPNETGLDDATPDNGARSFQTLEGRVFEFNDPTQIAILARLVETPGDSVSYAGLAEAILRANEADLREVEISRALQAMISRGQVDPNWISP